MSIPSWAVSGAKVICIATLWFSPPEPGYTNPAIGDILTIRDLNFSRKRQKWGASFTEKYIDDIYGLDYFRPLITKTAEEDAAMIRRLVDEMPVHSRLERVEELLNQ